MKNITYSRILPVIAGIVLLGSIVMSYTSTVTAQLNGTTLADASKTAIAHYERTFHWTIDKSVNPDTWNLFRGDSGTSTYTITVDKDQGTDAAWLDGQICMTNSGVVATENLAITDEVTIPGKNPILVATTIVDVSSNPVLDPGEHACYDYHVDIPSNQIIPGGTYKNTAHITITNHSGPNLGNPFGPNPSATVILPSSPTLINDSINVDDSNGGSWQFSDDGSTTYNKTFTCDNDQGEHSNTATIRETGDSDSAEVTVNCYALEVTKDATTSFKRTYHWTIDKSADQTSLTLGLDQSYPVNYSILVQNSGFTDSDWKVSGSISVHNPAPIDATINGLSDVVSGDIAATVDCDVEFPYTLVAGGTLNCTYMADLPDASDRTNTATATLQNNSYDSELNSTQEGTTDFSGSANVNFSNTPTTQDDECVDVSDTYAGSLGTVCIGDAPKTFSYSSTVGPYGSGGCGTYEITNTATITAQDSQTTGSDSWVLSVEVPCPPAEDGNGCTLTIGYWKTHAGSTGKNADVVTTNLPIWLGTSGGVKSIQVTTASQAVTILSMSGDASNGINKLYAQLLAAKLNIADGADDSDVASVIASADAFLATHNASDWSSLTKAQKQQVLSWMTTLDKFNNGLIGPGHCSE